MTKGPASDVGVVTEPRNGTPIVYKTNLSAGGLSA